jgi:hypothetical protein
VLARLDEIPGVSRSRAECSGHCFLLELDAGVADGVGARALEILGHGARLLTPEEAEAQHEARRRGEPWVTAEEARSLSFVEGRMLGVRVSAAIAGEGRAGDRGGEGPHCEPLLRLEQLVRMRGCASGKWPPRKEQLPSGSAIVEASVELFDGGARSPWRLRLGSNTV